MGWFGVRVASVSVLVACGPEAATNSSESTTSGTTDDDVGTSSEGGETTAVADTSTGSDPPGYEDVVEPGPDLAQARYRHVAVLLDDGNVFVAGGYDGSETIASIEIYRPATDDVVSGGALVEPRSDACALRLQDGRVMTIGGGLSSTDVWDPQTQQSELGPPLGYSAGAAMCMLTADGDVLVADSYMAGKGYLVERWRPGEDSFEQLPSATDLSYGGGHDGALVGDGSRMLLVGGLYITDEPPAEDPSATQIYDLGTQVFRDVEGWDGQGSILVETTGDALVWRTSTEGFLAARLDAASETFADISPAGEYNLHAMASMRTDGIVVLAGGFELDAEGELVATDRVLLWDPADATLDAVGTLGQPRSHGTATTLADGSVAIIGGSQNNPASAAIDVYH